MTDLSPSYTSLDPADWRQVRALSHRALDDMFDWLQSAGERPVWQPMPAEKRAELRVGLPRGGAPLEQIYADFKRLVLPYGAGNEHPRFFGWVNGGGTAAGILAELLVAIFNPNCGGRDHAAIEMERQVVAWAAEAVGFPRDAGGVLLGGSSMANMVALLVARRAAVGPEVRAEGVGGRGLVAYCSAAAHGCIPRAMDMAGLGTEALRLIPADADHRMEIGLLRAAIAADRAVGLQPFLVVGTAGTVDTGAFDDLAAVADTAAEAGLWFHVDGAFGATAAFSARMRPLLNGIERADSLAFDLGPDLSRAFRALKIWFTLRAYGADGIGRVVENSCAVAQYIAERVRREPMLELLAPVPLNIVCFRVARGAAELDRFNKEIVADLQESGLAAPSTTTIDGKLAIRAGVFNHRSTRQDADALIDGILEMARRKEAVLF
jgi:glutamate/tyrosine decarboxylase-like PLP-dependent enzyme